MFVFANLIIEHYYFNDDQKSLTAIVLIKSNITMMLIQEDCYVLFSNGY